MPLRYLREGLPTSPTLTVTQLPCRAKLDQNESPFELPAELKADLLAELSRLEWSRYPQPSEYGEVKQRFAEALGLDPATIALTAGCDQAIQGAHFLAGGPGRRALVFEPTYPMLPHAGLMAGTTVRSVVLGPEYDLRPEHVRSPEAELILLASPNNPTGSLIPEEVIEAALDTPAAVLIDEAYADFSRVTVADKLPDHPNLMIGRSCSKSLLAGVRLGYLIARPEAVVRLDQLLTAPYHLSHAQLLIARRFAEVRPHVEAAAGRVIAERERLAAALAGLGLPPAPSAANFLLVHHHDAAALSEGLAREGVRVRYAPKLAGMSRSFRITVGKPEENDLLLEGLKKLL